ncbi:MAG: ABC transporter substrate-binding protein [Acidimicrobiales bacterium]
MSNIDRRRFLAGGLKAGAALGAAGIGGTLLDACGSSKATTLTTVGKKKALQVGVNTGKPVLGGSVAFGTEAEETGMDPTEAHFDSTGVCYARAVFDPLAMILEDGTVEPYLAESITPNSTYSKWRIKVRPGVVFHDGTKCDGQALLFCMREFLTSGLTNFAFTNYMDIAHPTTAVTLVDDLTIQMNMEAPWVPFNYWLAGYIGGQIAYMFSPKAYMKGESQFDIHPVGTGPFVYQDWVIGSHFTLTKNPHYWRKDRFGNQLPYLDSWTFNPQPTVSTRYSYLTSGTIDMMHTDDDPTILLIDGNKNLTAIGDNELLVGEPDIGFAMINCSDPVMKDLRLRQALAYGTSQQEYIDVIGKKIITPTDGLFPKPSPYYSKTGYPSFDQAKAKSLVASWMKDNGGNPPSITYTTTATETSLYDASVVQAMWQAIGFKVKVTTVQQAALINDALYGKFQVFSWRQFSNVNPDLNYVFWATTSGPINFARNVDPKIQTALDAARQSTDPTVSVTSYEEVNKRLAVDLPYIYYGRDVWYVAATLAVQNWNNPTSPSGKRGLSTLSGTVWPTEVWKQKS